MHYLYRNTHIPERIITDYIKSNPEAICFGRSVVPKNGHLIHRINLNYFSRIEIEIDDKYFILLADLPNLTELKLHYRGISAESAKDLAKLTNLTDLDLSSNKVGDEGAIALANLTNLTNLNLSGNKIGDEGAKDLAKLTNLTNLNLSGNKIGDESAKDLAKLTNLTDLDLSGNKIGDDGAIALAEAPFLNRIRILLQADSISEKTMKALAECSKKKNFVLIGLGERNDRFYTHLKESWSQGRRSSTIRSSRSVKLGEYDVKNLFFNLARGGATKEQIELLLDDAEKYPFLINSRDSQGHTIAHFYNHDPEMQRFFFERGMIPKKQETQRRDNENRGDDLAIVQSTQSVHASLITKRTSFLTKKLVENTKSFNKEQWKKAADSCKESILSLFEEYQNDPVRLNLLSLTSNEKRSVMEKTLNASPVPNDKEFIKIIVNKAEQTLKEKYLKKNSHGEYVGIYSTQMLQYDYTKGNEKKITVPECIGRMKILIDNYSIPLREKKELLVTLMEQNPELVKSKLLKIKGKLGNSQILDKEKFDREELHGLLEDSKEIDELFKEISGLNIEEVWREQKTFVLLKQIYVAATAYGKNRSACLPGTWTQIISSINEISSEIVAQYDILLEEEQKKERKKGFTTKENIKPFMEGLSAHLIEYVGLNPELKKDLMDFGICIVDIKSPGEITFKQQKILAEINKYFSEKIKDTLPEYNRDVPYNSEYQIIISGLPEEKTIQEFCLQTQGIEDIEQQDVEQIEQDEMEEIDGDINIIDEYPVTEYIEFSERLEQQYIEELYLEQEYRELLNTELRNAEQQCRELLNTEQNENKHKNRMHLAVGIAISGVTSGVAVAVNTEMLVLGAAIVGVFLVAAALVCYFSNPRPLSNPKPPSSLTDIDPTKYETMRFVG